MWKKRKKKKKGEKNEAEDMKIQHGCVLVFFLVLFFNAILELNPAL